MVYHVIVRMNNSGGELNCDMGSADTEEEAQRTACSLLKTMIEDTLELAHGDTFTISIRDDNGEPV